MPVIFSGIKRVYCYPISGTLEFDPKRIGQALHLFFRNRHPVELD